MTSEMEVALAFVARREAKRSMSAARWAHLLSFDLAWMNPGQARTFVERAVRAGLLGDDEDGLRFVLDPTAIEVPRGFRPHPDAEGPAPKAPASTPSGPDPFLAWVATLAAAGQTTREQVLAQVGAVQERFGGLLTAEAAVLVLAKESGRKVAEAAKAASVTVGVVRP